MRLPSVHLLWLIVAVMSAPAIAADKPSASCKLKRVALLPAVSVETNRIHIPATLGDTETYLILDTGGFRSFIFDDYVKDHNLKVITATLPLARDGAGKSSRKGVWISPIQIGNMRREEPYAFILSAGGGEKTSKGDSVAGIFGADFLQTYDIELNFQSNEVSFFDPGACKPQAPYWANEWVEIPFDNRNDHIIMDVELDGKKIKAMLDTGAPGTILDLDTAKSLFGFDVATGKSTGNATWAMGKQTSTYGAKFKSLSFDGIVVQNPKVTVTDMKGSLQPMIVGMQHLRMMRLLISYSRAIIFATPAQ